MTNTWTDDPGVLNLNKHTAYGSDPCHNIRYFPPKYNLRLSVLSRGKYQADVILVLANEMQQNIEIKLTSTKQCFNKI